MPELYKIVDDEDNTIHIGTEDEMQTAYMVMAWDEKTLHRMHQEPRLAALKEKYRVPVKGKVKMIRHVASIETAEAGKDGTTDS